MSWKKYFGSRTVRKKISVFLSEENLEEKTQRTPPHPRPPKKSNGPSLNRCSRDVAHMVSCYFLVYFHCNKQYKKANKTDGHPRYPFFHCDLYRHYRNSSHVSCRVILTCAKIRQLHLGLNMYYFCQFCAEKPTLKKCLARFLSKMLMLKRVCGKCMQNDVKTSWQSFARVVLCKTTFPSSDWVHGNSGRICKKRFISTCENRGNLFLHIR